MLKKLLLSGAALTALSTFAVAQTTPAPADATPPAAATDTANPGAINAEAAAAKTDPNLFANIKGADVVGQNDESVGSVADLLIDPNGDLRGLVIAHGGIVGIGKTYRQYDVSALPMLEDGKIRVGELNTAALEGVPEYTYPTAETGRAATDSAAPAGTAPGTAPAEVSASADPVEGLIPVTNLVGAEITNEADKASVSDVRFEGNKLAAVVIDKGSLGLGNDVTEVKFEDLQITGTAAEPKLALKAGSQASPSVPAAGDASAPAVAPSAPASDAPAATDSMSPSAPAPAAP